MKRPLFFVLIIMLLASMACSLNLNIPRIQTGATQTMDINEPVSNNSTPNKVEISMGAGTLNLTPGADNLVTGSIKYNVAAWQPVIDHPETGDVSISQGKARNFEGIPTSTVINDWKLKLNASVPLDLSIKAGAYDATMDLTGLHLHSLDISDGAAKTTVSFNSPNPEKMTSFSYTTGASQVELKNLANANFSDMTFQSGAGDYTLDFNGKLQQDTSVDISSGVSNMTIIIPDGTNVKVINLGAISNIDPQGTWTVNGNTYRMSGTGFTLTLHVNMSLGNLKLVHQSQ